MHFVEIKLILRTHHALQHGVLGYKLLGLKISLKDMKSSDNPNQKTF